MARDRGDLDRLQEIAADPNGFLLRQGMASLDFDEDNQVLQLRRLYEALQARILDAIESLETLRSSAEYEIYLASTSDPERLQENATSHAKAFEVEIARLEQEAQELANEIKGLAEGAGF